MDVTFDPVKRDATLKARGLDFADAPQVFAGIVLEYDDDWFDYGEIRTITVGVLLGTVVVIVWTDRDGVPHIISMRPATKGESDEYFRAVG